MEDLTPSGRIARCAQRPGERWRTVPLSDLEAAAVELWRDQHLREHPPAETASRWLSPVSDH